MESRKKDIETQAETIKKTLGEQRYKEVVELLGRLPNDKLFHAVTLLTKNAAPNGFPVLQEMVTLIFQQLSQKQETTSAAGITELAKIIKDYLKFVLDPESEASYQTKLFNDPKDAKLLVQKALENIVTDNKDLLQARDALRGSLQDAKQGKSTTAKLASDMGSKKDAKEVLNGVSPRDNLPKIQEEKSEKKVKKGKKEKKRKEVKEVREVTENEAKYTGSKVKR